MKTGSSQLDLGFHEMSAGTLRDQYRELVGRRLPAIARERDWPIHNDHCFARVLLDNACGAPWREVIAPPAWRNAADEVIAAAISLGENAIAGQADISQLNRRSLEMRGKKLPSI
ncbi:MAG: GCN5-related N-acetyltransferase [Pseudomonadota bacterium]